MPAFGAFIAPRSALDLVFGWYSHWSDRDYINDGAYAHVTYLVQPLVARGKSVLVPVRLGIGVAVFDDAGRFNEDLHVAARFPLQIGIMFRRTPLEIYGEIALKMIGIRFYF